MLCKLSVQQLESVHVSYGLGVTGSQGLENPNTRVGHSDLDDRARIPRVSRLHQLRGDDASLRVTRVLDGISHELHQDIEQRTTCFVLFGRGQHEVDDAPSDALYVLDVADTLQLDGATGFSEAVGSNPKDHIFETYRRREPPCLIDSGVDDFERGSAVAPSQSSESS